MDGSCERFLKATKSCKISAGVVDVTSSEDENYVKGGILTDSKVAWVCCGPRLTTINCRDGSKRTGWTFGRALQDAMYKIVCVEELPVKTDGCPILIVSCEGEAPGSSLCFWHSGSSRVLKSINFAEKITSLSVVSKSNETGENLSKFFRAWNGIVAVGTATGKVYLLDVWWKGLEKCIDDYRIRLYDEQRQSKMAEISVQDLINHELDLKTSSVRNGSSTLALWLNEESLQRDRGVQNILGRTPREFLAVSALKYFPQAALLAVGYNTSCFQLWNLSTLTLQYTSDLLEAMLPVFSFSLLEPSDDPKFVCYLWSLHHSVDEDSLPFARMHMLSYREKHLNRFTNHNYYEGFSFCIIRYQLDLGNEIDSVVGGRIICCQALHRTSSRSSPLCLQSDAESDGSTEDTSASLLSITWEVWTPNQTGVMRRLTLFDLNQWYREQMPNTSDQEYSHFMSHFCLPDGPLLTAKVLPNSVRQFVMLQSVDEHFYPSGTSFECVCLEHLQVVTYSHTGLQRECLQTIQEGGPSALIIPTRLYKLCTQTGIKALLAETTSPTSSITTEQREYVLSVALENGLSQFLRNCVRDWADGSHAVAGCTLPSLLRWAWGRVQRYKKWLDRLCVPLFDYSGTALDSNDLRIFHYLTSLLHSLHDLFRLVLNKYRNYILQDSFEQQYLAINMVIAFYDSVLWCVRHRVLPEINVEDAHLSGNIPYLTEKIVNFTITRRAELHHLAKSLKQPAPTSGLLLIDAVIAQEGGGTKLTAQWEREGGGTTVGKYPPPSVQSLLRTYLVREIPLHIKHFIVSYLLQDIVHELSGESLNEKSRQKLLEYPLDFGMTESQCKIVQAFWCLDHKDFKMGVSLLLDSCVSKEDLQVYQHRTVVSLLAASGQHRLALTYLNVKQPPLNDLQDIRMKMTLLLVNDLIHEAFEFQRKHNRTLSAELLQQFYKGCVEMNKLDVVFKLPLNTVEEEGFMEFLEHTSHPQADDLKVLYLLSRSRYIEAIDMNERLRSVSGSRRGVASLPLGHSPLGPQGHNLFSPAKAVLTTRDLIISSVAKSLPAVTRELADLCNKEKNFTWKQVARPTPLSVVVHTGLTTERLPFYKMTNSQLLKAAVSKTRETWAPLLATPAALKRKFSKVEGTPFLGTPLVSRLNTSGINLSPPTETTSSLGGYSVQSKRARLDISSVKEKGTILDKTLEMDTTCPETALLHTPLVARSIKQQAKVTTTPHSILKGRSANNTPARSERSVGSPAVVRQIRFSLPLETDSSSSGKEDRDSDSCSPSVSPRKSIHNVSSVQSRKSTPANLRFPRTPIRNIITSLKFDDEENTNGEQIRPERSATAEALLRKISTSPNSSDDSYFSFKSTISSSSSKGIHSKDSELNFKLPLGLEDYMDDSDNLSQQTASTNDQELIISANEIQVQRSLISTSNSETPDKDTTRPGSYEASKTIENDKKQQTFIVDETPDLKWPKEVKIVVECSGTKIAKTPVLKGYDDLEENSVEANSSFAMDVEESYSCHESNDAPNNAPIFKWTKELNDENSETLKLQVSKEDDGGLERCVAIVTLSEEIPMFYSESLQTEVTHNQSISTTIGTFGKSVEETKEKEEDISNCTLSFENESTSLPKSEDNFSSYQSKLSNVDSLKIKNTVQATNNIVSHDVTVNTGAGLGNNSSSANKQSVETNVSLQKELNQDEISINDVPLPQVLEEILKRGRISSSPKDKSKMLSSEISNSKDEGKILKKNTESIFFSKSTENSKLDHDLCTVSSRSNHDIEEGLVVDEKEILLEIDEKSVGDVFKIGVKSDSDVSLTPEKELTTLTAPPLQSDESLSLQLDESVDEPIPMQQFKSSSRDQSTYTTVEDNNVSDSAVENQSLESLKLVEMQDEYYDEDNDDYDGDVDIYEDIGNEEEASSPITDEEEYESHDNRGSEDKSSDVICLNSSSDEEAPESSPYKPSSTEVSKRHKLPNETLDYEDDLDESDEEELHYSESSRDTTDKGSIYKEESNYHDHSFSYSSDTGEEGSRHGNRSWKTETRITSSIDSLDKCNDAPEEDSIESPPFEIIGQDSQSENNTEVVGASDRKLKIILEESEENRENTCQSEDNTEVVGGSDSKLGIIVEESEENREDTYEESGAQILNTALDRCSPLQEVKETDNIEINYVDETISQENKNDSVIKIIDNKRKQVVETGSILDLKKKRRKRYSSTSDLSLNKHKSRRRSCSFHDFASMIIAETKSAKALSTETIPKLVTAHEQDVSHIYEETSPEPHSEFAPAISTPLCQSQSWDTPESENSKTSSLRVEPGSVASSYLQEDHDVFSLSTAKILDYSKKRGKSIANRFSISLQNITEEISCASGISENPDNSLRRSLSNNDLAEQTPLKSYTKLPIRYSSDTSVSEYIKAHESEMALESSDKHSSVDCIATSIDIDKSDKTLKKRIRKKSQPSPSLTSVEHNNQETITDHEAQPRDQDFEESYGEYKQIKSCSFENESQEQGYTVTSEPGTSQNLYSFELETQKTNRMKRASSEPPIYQSGQKPDCDKTSLFKKRRSSSLLKMDNVDKKRKHSIKERCSQKIINESLKNVAHSDEDSLANNDIDTIKNMSSVEINDTLHSQTSITSSKVIETPKKGHAHVDLDEHSKLVDSPAGRTRRRLSMLSNADVAILSKDADSNDATTQNLEVPDLDSPESYQRAHSEPPVSPTTELPKLTRKRRSSSLLQIQNVHKIVLRPSLRGRYSQKISYKPLEVIVNSDEDSLADHTIDKNLSSEDIQSSEEISAKKSGRSKKVKDNTSKKNTNIEDDHQECSRSNNTTKECSQSNRLETSNDEKNDPLHSQTSIISDQVMETPKKNLSNIGLDEHSKLVGSSARRTRRSASMSSNADVVIPTKDASSNDVTTQNLEVSDTGAFERNQRAHSEPSVSPTRDLRKLTKLRRSASLLKIQNVHKKVFLRKSLKGRYSQKINYEPLEVIVNSDEDSLTNKTIDKNVSSEDIQIPGETPVKKRGRPKKVKDNPKNIEDTYEESGKNNDTKKKHRKLDELEMSNVEERNEPQTSITNNEVIQIPKNIDLDQHLQLFDSTARRTRRSLSRLSDTEILTPTKDTRLAKLTTRRRTRQSGTMSDFGSPSQNPYAESEASDVSTTHTPTRRSLRNKSLSATSTPTTPNFIPEEYLLQRRLTRHQHAQLQKSFELSLKESLRIHALEALPEEDSTEAEMESSANISLLSTTSKSSAKNQKKTVPVKSSKQKRRKTTKK